MRATACLLGLCVLLAAGAARAQSSTASYTREGQICEARRAALEVVVKDSAKLQAELQGAELEALNADVENVSAALKVQTDFCAAIAGYLKVTRENPKPDAKTSRDIRNRRNKIDTLRAASRKILAATDPTVAKLIPRIMPRSPGEQLDSAKRFGQGTEARFPSGRTIRLPRTNGTWRLSAGLDSDTADYTDPINHAFLVTKQFEGGTCDDQRTKLAAKVDPIKLVDYNLPEAKALDVAWQVTYTTKETMTSHYHFWMCLPARGGGFLASAQVTPSDKKKDDKIRIADEDFWRVLVLMLQARTVPVPRSTGPANGTSPPDEAGDRTSTSGATEAKAPFWPPGWVKWWSWSEFTAGTRATAR